MLDIETESLWSHLLGEAMRGELKGALLTPIASNMTTWKDWKQSHPRTTVLALSRTRHQAYTKEFYRDPSRFVVGFAGDRGIQHCSFATLKDHPLVNTGTPSLPLLIVFDQESTSAQIFNRRVGDRVLSFSITAGMMRDQETGSTWNPRSAAATAGPLKGQQLAAHVGIISYAEAWSSFHPDSREVQP